MKKLISLVLALAMTLMVGAAFAADDGSISVTNATKGQTYEAFLIFTASPSDPDDVTKDIIYTATAAQVAVNGFGDCFDTIIDADGNYSISVKDGVSENNVIKFIKNNLEALKQGSAIAGTWADNDTITFSNLKYGYYYISSSLGSLITIDTAGKAVQVFDKNETTPEGPDKKITAEDNAIDESLDQTGLNVTENKTSVGSTETFEVTFSATNWVKATSDAQEAGTGSAGTKVTEWNFVDTPTGLDIKSTTVKIYVNEEDVTSSVTDIAVDATTGALTFTIPWVDTDGKHLYATQSSGSELIPVKVVYDAVVKEEAATAVATNEVEIKYNNDTQLGEKVTTDTYTYKFKVLKTDENQEALIGAEFELYFGNTLLKFDLVSEGVYRYNPNGTVTRIAPVGANAEALITGLDDATYVLKETVVPGGYNKAADTTVSNLSRVDAEDTKVASVTIENNKGTELPSTGGIGTTIFYVVGGILLLGAAIVLVARRKANN